MNEELKVLLDLLRRSANELDGWMTAFPDSAGKSPELVRDIETLLQEKYPEHDQQQPA